MKAFVLSVLLLFSLPAMAKTVSETCTTQETQTHCSDGSTYRLIETPPQTQLGGAGPASQLLLLGPVLPNNKGIPQTTLKRQTWAPGPPYNHPGNP